MSRSYKKYPAGGNCNGSDKQFKRQANRKLRAKIRMALKAGKNILPLLRELSQLYSAPKDGKQWYGDKIARKYKLYRK